MQRRWRLHHCSRFLEPPQTSQAQMSCRDAAAYNILQNDCCNVLNHWGFCAQAGIRMLHAGQLQAGLRRYSFRRETLVQCHRTRATGVPHMRCCGQRAPRERRCQRAHFGAARFSGRLPLQCTCPGVLQSACPAVHQEVCRRVPDLMMPLKIHMSACVSHLRSCSLLSSMERSSVYVRFWV